MGTIEVKNLSKVFNGGVTAVSSASFSVDAGHLHGFIGPNGAGKTTTMRILATIEPPSDGDAFIDGFSIVEHPYEVRKRIAFVPDHVNGFELTTVYECLDFFARAYGLNYLQRKKTIAWIEEFTSLGDLRDTLVSSLSRGMQQRVSLARALVNEPSVLILDEPAANLDPKARIELKRLLKQLAQMGKSLLISSHILSELEEICDSFTIIDKGKVLRSGTLEAISNSSETSSVTIMIKTAGSFSGLREALCRIPSVVQRFEEVKGFTRFEFKENSESSIAALLSELVKAGVPVCSFHVHSTGIEDIFMEITGAGNKK